MLLEMKRFCQTLTLVDNPEMISQYVEAHRHVWPEVIEGQRKVGIMSMEIWRSGRSCAAGASSAEKWQLMDCIFDSNAEQYSC